MAWPWTSGWTTKAACLEISRPMVAAKIANSRTLLLRAVRDHPEKPGAAALDTAAQDLTRQIDRARRADSLDRLRGIEGDSAATYFGVFECQVDPGQFAQWKARLLKIIDPEQDSVRFYFLGDNWERRVEHHGAKTSYNINDPLIV